MHFCGKGSATTEPPEPITTESVTTEVITTESPPLTTVDPSCEVSDVDRTECGFSGITIQQCQDLDCCWSSPELEGPWCFYKAGYRYFQMPSAKLTSKSVL